MPSRFFLVLVLLALLVGLVWFFAPAPPTVHIFSLEDGAKALKPTLFQKALWRTGLFRTRQSVLMQGTLMEIEDAAVAKLRTTTLTEPPLLMTNGVQIWILGDNELVSLAKTIREVSTNDIISSPRIQTASGMQGSIFVGNTVPINGVQTSVGIEMDLLPRSHRDRIDVTTLLKMTQPVTNMTTNSQATNAISIKTNLALAGHFRVQNGKGIFLLQDAEREKGNKFGVILSLKPSDNKGK
jgi:hypothetical protein